MSQQMYGKSREEPSYGYGQGSNTTRQSPKKPVFINYYPSGNTNNPQRVVAQVETVTREFVRNPAAVNETRIHHGDGQSKREDEFINKIRDETIKATADFNNASRINDPKVLTTNFDQLQLSDNSRNRNENGGWIEPTEPNRPRKVAELMNRVSNWSDYRAAKPISSDGYNNLGYDQSRSYAIRRDNNINNGWIKLPNVSQGYDHIQMENGGDTKSWITPPSSVTKLSYEEKSYYSGNRGRATDDVYTKREDMMNQQPSLRQQVRYGNGYSSGLGNQSVRNYDQVEYDQVYGSGLPRSGYVERPEAGGATTVISSIDAVAKYKGSFVPLMKTGEQKNPNVLMKI